MIFRAFSTEPSINDTDTLCQHYLTILYHEVQQKNPIITGNLCETYGEILYPSVNKLLSAIQLSDADVFVDYGSGVGKMLIQVFLKTVVKEAYGIEIVPELHQQALNAAQRLQQELPDFYQNNRKLTFWLGNFLEIPIPSATVAIIVSTCFSQPLLNALGKIIEATPSIHTVLSLRPVSTLQRLPFKKAIAVECSWDSALCYIYSTKTVT
ncbi:hypothetical protein Lnau_0840 [Legionella nautarum]|uniref:Histone-lysine N-methyltransferase, H3 lysine-79 specific n=1 Tax=Legionella nautarum TaxID=45070 RepID=A0A0W0WU66_9GAMM|nr:hypothetical protein [Legionella nautarum]KTD35856.1 hypothetical protein Lnau_0840 [Legionella nautarum]